MKQMDSGDFNQDESKARRRSARQSSKPVFYSAGLKSRAPLKRTRKLREEDDALVRAVNGSKSLAEKDDDESPVKIQKVQELEEAGDESDRGAGDQTDVEMDESADQDEHMNSDEEVEQDHELLKSESRIDDKLSANVREENLEPVMTLRSRRSIHKTVDPELPETPLFEPSSLSAVPIQPNILENREGFEKRNTIINHIHPNEKIRDGFRSTLYERGDSNRQSKPSSISVYPPIRQKAAQFKTPELTNLKKPVTSKASPASTSRGCTWYVCILLLLSLILIGLPALGLFAYQSSLSRADVVQPIIKENFKTEISAMQVHFPSQRSVFWTRSLKHLERHLQTVNPTEPVSLILTAGWNAERTLACLARSLATAFSISLNRSSILEIDGTTKTMLNSDQVKLDIDTALRNAFEGNKAAAVVHRFEELPPGSTLIFYRYCDHENAAYKKVFLAFTVMLSVEQIETDSSLSAVEDMVHNQIKAKFVSSDKSAMFNEMDVDKLSGLWSRISHVVLPVSAEEKIEQQGCEA